MATDIAMFVRAHALTAKELARDLMSTLIDLAEQHLDWAMPGYTHLQRAQPVYLSHHLLAYVWKFRRDMTRFDAALSGAGELPLGAGALAGVNFETSRREVARELAFPGIAENSIDAVSNRDFVLDYLAAAATCATHLSRLGAEIVLWSSEEFGFCEPSDAFASGSSIMPQKKNPDAAELLRAKAPRVVGHLAALHGVLHGLPLTYNKDLQEDKEHLFDAVDTIELSLRVAREMVRGSSSTATGWPPPRPTSCWRPPTSPTCWCAAGCPFREAHGIVAGLVRHALESGRMLSELTDAELAELAPQLGEGLAEVLTAGAWLESKVSEGGTALARVREQLDRARRPWTRAPLEPRRRGPRRPARGGLLRALRARRGARPRGLRGPLRRRRRADRGGRELSPGGARLPRLRGPDRPHAHAVRSAGPWRTSTARTGSTRS